MLNRRSFIARASAFVAGIATGAGAAWRATTLAERQAGVASPLLSPLPPMPGVVKFEPIAGRDGSTMTMTYRFFDRNGHEWENTGDGYWTSIVVPDHATS